MNPVVYRLLRGQLARSVWLYAFVGFAQFLMTGAYWALALERIPLIGSALGVWGALTSFNSSSLVWRSVPLAARDAEALQWWATAGVPGIFLTTILGLAWEAVYSYGLASPAPGAVLDCLFVNWAALGVIASFSASAWFASTFSDLKIVLCVSILAVLLLYGLPIQTAAQPYSILFMGAGLALLALSALNRGHNSNWRQRAPAVRITRVKRGSAPQSVMNHHGFIAMLLPLLKRSAILACMATSILAILHLISPGAAWVSFWVYFTIISTASFLLTYQFRGAIQPLRCLPLSASRLAVILQIVAVLPALTSILFTLLINNTLLDVGLDVQRAMMISLILISSQTVMQWAQVSNAAKVSAPPKFPVMRRLAWPLWLGTMVAYMGGNQSTLSGVGWFLVTVGVALCLIGHITLVRQLQSGMRPNPEQKVLLPS